MSDNRKKGVEQQLTAELIINGRVVCQKYADCTSEFCSRGYQAKNGYYCSIPIENLELSPKIRDLLKRAVRQHKKQPSTRLERL